MRRRADAVGVVCAEAGGLAIPAALLASQDAPVWVDIGYRSDDIFAHIHAWSDARREWAATAPRSSPLLLDDGSISEHIWYYCVVEAAPELRRRGYDADRAVALADLHRR